MEQDAGAAVLHAACFAAHKHRKQRRKDPEGTPYINHPLGVAKYISDAGVTDADVLQAAILHDTLEDTDTTEEELQKEFGATVASIVQECSDDKNLAKDVRKMKQLEHAAHASHKAKLVKLADKLYNCRDSLINAPPSWDAERIQGYLCWSHAVVQNCRGTNKKLEDQLDEVFASTFTLHGVSYPALVSETERPAFLEKYYASMRVVKD